jgi:hypothetical protein
VEARGLDRIICLDGEVDGEGGENKEGVGGVAMSLGSLFPLSFLFLFSCFLSGTAAAQHIIRYHTTSDDGAATGNGVFGGDTIYCYRMLQFAGSCNILTMLFFSSHETFCCQVQVRVQIQYLLGQA